MKKVYIFMFLLATVALTTSNVNAQDFPWPDMGEAKVIPPGAPGAINETINGDAGAFNHYVLKRGAIYLYTAAINNSGYPLMVTAEEGDGPLPIIKALGPAPGEEEAERIFHAEGDLYIKDLHLDGWDQGGNFTDNATVRLAADSITAVCKGIIFDFNRQNNFRVNAIGCKIYIEDCVIANQGYGQKFNQGFFFNTRGNFFPIAHFRNNTIYNMQNTVFTGQGKDPSRYGKIIFEFNTVMNTGSSGLRLGRPDSLIIKNNLFVNMAVLGDALYGDRDNFTEPYYFVTIDSLYTDTTNTELAKPYVDWRSNHFYLDPEVAALLPDSANSSNETLMHPYLVDLIANGTNNAIVDEKFPFANFPADINEYKAYIDDFYQNNEERADLPLFASSGVYNYYTDMDYDFSYAQSHPAYSAATDGGPIGDRNWFPDYVSTGVKNIALKDLLVYPNPATNMLHVKMSNNKLVDKIALYNIVGKQVKIIPKITTSEVSIDVRDIMPGMYFVRFYNGNNTIGVHKIVKK